MTIVFLSSAILNQRFTHSTQALGTSNQVINRNFYWWPHEIGKTEEPLRPPLRSPSWQISVVQIGVAWPNRFSKLVFNGKKTNETEHFMNINGQKNWWENNWTPKKHRLMEKKWTTGKCLQHSTNLSSKLIVYVSIPEKLSRDFSLPGGLSHLRQKWSSVNAPNLSPNWHCEENPLKKHMAFFATHAFYTHVFFLFQRHNDNIRQPTSLVPHLIAGPQGHAPGSGTCGPSSGDGPRAEPDGGKSAKSDWETFKTHRVEKGETSLIFLSMESLTPDFTQVSAWNLRVLERSCNCFCQCLQHQFQVSTHNCIDMYGKITWLESPWSFIFQRYKEVQSLI